MKKLDPRDLPLVRDGEASHSIILLRDKINEIEDWINETDHKLDKILDEDLELPEEECTGKEEDCFCKDCGDKFEAKAEKILGTSLSEPKEKSLRDAEDKITFHMSFGRLVADVYDTHHWLKNLDENLAEKFLFKSEGARKAIEEHGQATYTIKDPLGE